MTFLIYCLHKRHIMTQADKSFDCLACLVLISFIFLKSDELSFNNFLPFGFCNSLNEGFGLKVFLKALMSPFDVLVELVFKR